MVAKPHRSLGRIAQEIYADWGDKVNFAAKPYLRAMAVMHSVRDNYYHDSGREIVVRFLSNAGAWRGDKAKAIKAELKEMLK